MSNLIIDPTEKQLINPAFDKYMDGPVTRRELQAALDHFSKHLDALYATSDTQHIVINFLAEEKLNVTKDELLAYVQKKRQEMLAAIDKRAKAAERARAILAGEIPADDTPAIEPVPAVEAAGEQSNG